MNYILRSIVFLLIQCYFIKGKTEWRRVDAYSSCSVSCGDGFEIEKTVCIQSMEMHQREVDDSRCLALNLTRPVIKRPCNYGDCDSSYRWQVTGYGPCSQSCGLLGTMTREVNCVYIEKNNTTQIISPEEERQYCKSGFKPKERDSCNRRDCDPVMIPLEWQKCQQGDPCVPGKQIRDVKCVIVKMDGQEVRAAKRYCSRSPIKTWRPCWNPTNKVCDQKLNPEITEDHVTVVQMKRNQNLELKVGQHAFIIPFTNITVQCPTKHFAKQDLVWYHSSHGHQRYVGKSTERIMVDKDGRLYIDNFRPIDKGEWKCRADTTEASITLSQRSVAEGFMDWLKRTKLWSNEDMMNEDAKTAYRNQVIVQWVEGPWSECKAECGMKSNQTRLVRCEKVQAGVYEVLGNEVCEKRGLPRPITTKECQTAIECPRLEFTPDPSGKCTNECVRPGLAKKAGTRTCLIGTREVKLEKCLEQIDTNHLCDNPLCRLKWHAGRWSACSKSCGQNSFKSRSIRCVWALNGEQAGSQCVNHNMPLPNAITSCATVPCRSDCLDLMPNCESKKDLCRFSMFQYYCCKSCKEATEDSGQFKGIEQVQSKEDKPQTFTQE